MQLISRIFLSLSLHVSMYSFYITWALPIGQLNHFSTAFLSGCSIITKHCIYSLILNDYTSSPVSSETLRVVNNLSMFLNLNGWTHSLESIIKLLFNCDINRFMCTKEVDNHFVLNSIHANKALQWAFLNSQGTVIEMLTLYCAEFCTWSDCKNSIIKVTQNIFKRCSKGNRVLN